MTTGLIIKKCTPSHRKPDLELNAPPSHFPIHFIPAILFNNTKTYSVQFPAILLHLTSMSHSFTLDTYPPLSKAPWAYQILLSTRSVPFYQATTLSVMLTLAASVRQGVPQGWILCPRLAAPVCCWVSLSPFLCGRL